MGKFKLSCLKKEDESQHDEKSISVGNASSLSPQPPVHRFKNAKALIVGINYTGTPNELKGCVNDAHNVYAYLTQKQNINPANILVLTDEPHTSLDKIPTYKNIIAGIRWLVSNNSSTEHTSLYFHYSGHGTYLPDRNKDEDDQRDEAICPLDYDISGMLIDDVIRSELVDPIKEKSNIRVVCVFDSCHSGTIVDMRYTIKATKHKNKLITYSITENPHYPVSKCEVVVFSGCMDQQTSADAYISGQSQGMMTYAFLSTLNKYEDKQLTYKTFITELQQYSQNNKYQQIPQLSFNNTIDINSVYVL